MRTAEELALVAYNRALKICKPGKFCYSMSNFVLFRIVLYFFFVQISKKSSISHKECNTFDQLSSGVYENQTHHDNSTIIMSYVGFYILLFFFL